MFIPALAELLIIPEIPKEKSLIPMVRGVADDLPKSQARAWSSSTMAHQWRIAINPLFVID